MVSETTCECENALFSSLIPTDRVMCVCVCVSSKLIYTILFIECGKCFDNDNKQCKMRNFIIIVQKKKKKEICDGKTE